MRHNKVLKRPSREHAFRNAFAGAAVATGVAAGLGYAAAFSALAGWVVLGIGAAVAASLWMESRPGRSATPPPIATAYFGDTREP